MTKKSGLAVLTTSVVPVLISALLAGCNAFDRGMVKIKGALAPETSASPSLTPVAAMPAVAAGVSSAASSGSTGGISGSGSVAAASDASATPATQASSAPTDATANPTVPQQPENPVAQYSSVYQSAAVHHDRQYIYFQTNWAHMTRDQQAEVVQSAAQDALDAVSMWRKGESFPIDHSKDLIPESLMDKLTDRAQDHVNTDTPGWRQLLPAGFIVLVGGSGGAGALVHLGVAMDIGVVFVPVMVTRVNTTNGKISHYFDVSPSVVLFPHARAGVGIGAGGSFSFGAGLIWGNLNDAKEFSGSILSGSGSVKLGMGLEIKGSWIHNFKMNKNFAMATVEAQGGIEADANASGDVGAVIQLNKALSLFTGVDPQSLLSGRLPGDPSVPVSPIPMN